MNNRREIKTMRRTIDQARRQLEKIALKKAPSFKDPTLVTCRHDVCYAYDLLETVGEELNRALAETSVWNRRRRSSVTDDTLW